MHAAHVRRGEQRLERIAAREAARAGQKHDPGFLRHRCPALGPRLDVVLSEASLAQTASLEIARAATCGGRRRRRQRRRRCRVAPGTARRASVPAAAWASLQGKTCSGSRRAAQAARSSAAAVAVHVCLPAHRAQRRMIVAQRRGRPRAGGRRRARPGHALAQRHAAVVEHELRDGAEQEVCAPPRARTAVDSTTRRDAGAHQVARSGRRR